LETNFQPPVAIAAGGFLFLRRPAKQTLNHGLLLETVGVIFEP
jgi:hypothetical protein